MQYFGTWYIQFVSSCMWSFNPVCQTLLRLYKCERNGGSKGTWVIKYVCVCIHLSYYHLESCLTHHFSHLHTLSYFWHYGLKLHPQLDKSCIYYVWKYNIVAWYLKISKICYTILFLRHLVVRSFFPIKKTAT